VIVFALLLGWAIAWALRHVPGGWAIEAVLASTLIALRGLDRHVGAVADGLDQGLEAGRLAVGHIVGRDPESLDAPGVARAAIESLAENFSDGIVAPVFWYAVFGLPGLAAYKEAGVTSLNVSPVGGDPAYVLGRLRELAEHA